MNKKEATEKFMEYAGKEYNDIKIVSIDERNDRFLFEFIEDGDDFPIDYPIISVMKTNGEIKELSFLKAEDRMIIYG